MNEHPRDPRVHSALGMAYAGLGRKAEAVREGKLAVELWPTSKDALDGPAFVLDLARIHTMVGDYDSAMERIEYLFSIPWGALSVPLLRLDPRFDPLRDHPRYKNLVAEFSRESS